ncbi:MAG: helix-turn-helix transcriptional regulator [Elusimicrobia bacterium]|nr:helix-turn-helix transcriptional regulator [Elusimicrobiota bacterium]
MSIAESLRRLRKASGLTQQKLAEKAGVSMIVVTKVEQGTTRDPAMSSLIKLADVFEVSRTVPRPAGMGEAGGRAPTWGCARCWD